MRPVYEVLGFYNVLYLYSTKHSWEISDDWSGANTERRVVFRVVDSALRPEYITSEWQLNQNGSFVGVPTIRLRCSGHRAGPEGACTINFPCENAARCKYVPQTATTGELLCLCGPNHVGLTCGDDIQTCSSQKELDMPDNALFYSANGHQLGDVMTYFCSERSENSFFFSKCEAQKSNGTLRTEWVHHGDCDLSVASSSRTSHLLWTLLLLCVALLH